MWRQRRRVDRCAQHYQHLLGALLRQATDADSTPDGFTRQGGTQPAP